MLRYRLSLFRGERIRVSSALVAELVQRKVDVLVISNFTGILAAKQATKTIPMVMIVTRATRSRLD